jgi:hypothetical protein
MSEDKDEYREWMVKTLYNNKAWGANYNSGGHVICPICFASIYQGYLDPSAETIKQAHITWHERNNI